MQTATRQGQGGVVGQLQIATSRVQGDRIIVTLTATKPNKDRVSIHRVFDYNGVEIDNAGNPTGGPGLTFAATQGTQPQFPLDAYKAALAAQNEAEVSRLAMTFRKDLEAFQAGGGSTEAERIGNAVYSYLQKYEGVSEADGDHLILRRDAVNAKAPTRSQASEPGVWLVQLAPTWGF